MSTYLQLCQKLASETGTAGDDQPETVSGQAGRLKKMVRWVNDAHRLIQTTHRTWRWLEGSFSGTTTASTQAYSGSDMNVSSRFAEFLCMGDIEDRYWSYLTATGDSDDGQLKYMSWRDFTLKYNRGEQTDGRPIHFTIQPDGRLALGPTPDASYTVRGPYLKDVQELSADGDIPEMPSRFHDLIVEVALTYWVGAHDETPQVGIWHLRQIPRFRQLEREQLPALEMPGPFA